MTDDEEFARSSNRVIGRCLGILIIAVALCFWITRPRAAELPAYREGATSVFGTYSKAYLDRQRSKRWKELCKGGGRYQAMSEAYDARKPDTCNGATRWMR